MPLHLLGKKSWNVYNQDNVEKVKRDEAAAAAREAAEEQRMQEVDVERRIQILRGHEPVAPAEPPAIEQAPEHDGRPHGRERKRRRIAGEDDTDRDIRHAREDQAVAVPKAELQLKSNKSSDAPLMDHRGHIDLFPMDGSKRNAPKNLEVEAEKAKKKKEYEDQFTMRFSNAAGFKQSIGDKPWYQSLDTNLKEANETPSKDVWGNEDPRRKEREKLRVAANDPMAAMQQGVSQLREVEKERKQWQQERDREMEEMARSEKQKRRKSRRKRDVEELEGFSLDTPDHGGEDKRPRHHHRRHRHRSRSRDSKREDSRRKHRRNRDGGKNALSTDNNMDSAWAPGAKGRYSNQFAPPVS
ncbi:MAG: hypothetical protein LQ352_005509 [Teloschistes flavicans]|nr:MAG: hypothetical protein LQ352_005509 [Teloschistes flavicans]